MSPLRRLLTLSSTLVCLLGLATTACGDDGEKADKSTTTEKSPAKADGDDSTDSTESTESTEPESTEDSVPTTVSDAEFTASLQPAIDQLNAAKEPCDVVDAVSQLFEMADPANPEQNRQAVEFLVLVVNKAADTTEDAAQAEELRSSGQALSDYAESVGYSAEKLDFAGEGPDIPEWDTLDAAMTEYFDTYSQECAPADEGSEPATP